MRLQQARYQFGSVFQFTMRIRMCSKTPGGDVASAILQRSEAKLMRVATWGFADRVNCCGSVD